MINTKKTTLRHIINKLVKTSDKEKILKSSQRGKKSHVMDGRMKIITIVFSFEAMQTRGRWNSIFKVLKLKTKPKRVSLWEAEGFLTHTHRGERGNVTAEAEVGVMQPQAKKRLEPPEAGRGQEQMLPCSLRGEHCPVDTWILDFWPPELGDNTFLLF